jgi:hypothetical protein
VQIQYLTHSIFLRNGPQGNALFKADCSVQSSYVAEIETLKAHGGHFDCFDSFHQMRSRVGVPLFGFCSHKTSGRFVGAEIRDVGETAFSCLAPLG